MDVLEQRNYLTLLTINPALRAEPPLILRFFQELCVGLVSSLRRQFNDLP